MKLSKVSIYLILIRFGELEDFPGFCMASSEGYRTFCVDDIMI